MSFGQRLKQLREENGLSQIQFAKLIKVTEQRVVLWESDRAMPQSNEISEISSLFGVPVEELLQRDTPSEIKTPFASVEVTNDEKKILETLKSEKYLLYIGVLALAVVFLGLSVLFIAKAVIFFNKTKFSTDLLLAVFNAVRFIFACIVCIIIRIITSRNLKKRAKSIYDSQSGKSMIIFAFDDKYEIIENCGGIETVTTFKNTELCSLKELESCYIFTFIYGKIFVADKATLSGDGARLTQNASLIGRFKYASILSLDCSCNIDSRKVYKNKTLSGFLLVLSFSSFIFAAGLPSIFLSAGQTVNVLNGFEKVFSQISPFCTIVFPLMSLVFGIVSYRKGMRTKINIITGAAMIVFIAFWATLISMGFLHLKG